MMPMSCVTNSAMHTQGVQDAHHIRRLILLVVAAIRLGREAQPTQVGRDNRVVFDECARQIPHMSPVVPKPCSMTTAGPCPPTRTWILAPLVSISRDCIPAGKGWMPS